MCDACGDNIGAVLQQDGHVVAYESKRQHDAKLHSGVYEKELLVVIHALTNWKHLLLGADFVVKTDHQSLRYFLTQTKLSKKHFKWANLLSMFHFQIVYVPGVQNRTTDALSRRPQVHNIAIAYHQDLQDMQSQNAEDLDFGEISQQMLKG